MARQPTSASEWTSAVEAAVQSELLRRSRRLKWAVLLSLLVGSLAVVLALSLRGVSWAELTPHLQRRLAPLIATQVSQGEVQIGMAAALARLETELRALQAELASRPVPPSGPDPEIRALRWRLQRLEAALNEATAERIRLEWRIEQSAAHSAARAASAAAR